MALMSFKSLSLVTVLARVAQHLVALARVVQLLVALALVNLKLILLPLAHRDGEPRRDRSALRCDVHLAPPAVPFAPQLLHVDVPARLVVILPAPFAAEVAHHARRVCHKLAHAIAAATSPGIINAASGG